MTYNAEVSGAVTASAELPGYARRNYGEKNMAKWVVDVKGRAGSESFEITVLRDDNEHGKRSYGWINKDKLLITHNGGPCRWPLTPMVWDKAVKLAHEVADELNAAEGNNFELGAK